MNKKVSIDMKGIPLPFKNGNLNKEKKSSDTSNTQDNIEEIPGN